MKCRIQVFVTDSQASYLSKLKEKSGESIANIIRRAIELIMSDAR